MVGGFKYEVQYEITIEEIPLLVFYIPIICGGGYSIYFRSS